MEGERACVPCAGCKDKGILMASTRKGKKMHSLQPDTQKVLFFLPSQFSVVCPNGFSFFFFFWFSPSPRMAEILLKLSSQM